LFINFFYPCFLYPIDPEYFSVFKIAFNADYINKGTALALLSGSCLMFGASIPARLYRRNNYYSEDSEHIDHFLFSLCTAIVFLSFIITAGREFLAGGFTSRSPLSDYILQVLTCCISLTAIIFFRSYTRQKAKGLFVVVAFSYIVLFLKVGDRGPALSLLLVVFSLYAAYVRRLHVLVLLALAILGGFLMHLIGLGRSTVLLNDSENVITRGLNSLDDDKNIYMALTESLVCNVRNLYVGLEYVEDYGVNFGRTSIFPATLSVFPFTQSLYESVTGDDLETSGQFFTRLAFGDNPSYGLGTNLVSDVYISFGVFGNALLFFFLGRLVEVFRNRGIKGNFLIPSIIYFMLLSNAVYWSRSGFFTTMKLLVWTLIIYFGISLLEREVSRRVNL